MKTLIFIYNKTKKESLIYIPNWINSEDNYN